MATTAAPWSMPYPVGTDRVMDGDDVIHALADRVALKLTESLVNVPITGVACTLGASWGGSCVTGMRSGWAHVTIATTRTSWAAGDTICTVPVGYRPSGTLYFMIECLASGSYCPITIESNGLVKPVLGGTSQGGLNGFISYPL